MYRFREHNGWSFWKKRLNSLLSKEFKKHFSFDFSGVHSDWFDGYCIGIKYNGKYIVTRNYSHDTPGISRYNYFNGEFIRYEKLKHEESAKENTFFFRMFSLLDKRTGKRTLEKFLDDYYYLSLSNFLGNNNEMIELLPLYEAVFELRGIKYKGENNEENK